MTPSGADDERFMARALELAANASAAGEVPVGAVIVVDGEIIGEGANSSISTNDATAHAEILAIRNACDELENYRLPGATAYLSLEPCTMCAGAIVHARVARVVCATHEPRFGAAGSMCNLLQNSRLNHQCEVEFGLMQSQSSDLLKTFFRARR